MHRSYYGTARLLVLASAVLLSSALVTHHPHKLVHALRCTHHHSNAPLRISSISSQTTDHISTPYTAPTSPESNFWAAIAGNTTLTTSNTLPAIHGLDKETGPLPPGAYRSIDGEVAAPCHISIGVRPPPDAKHIDDEVWKKGVSNCQKMIESGFNTFRMNTNSEHIKQRNNRHKTRGRPRSPASIALGRLQQRHLQTELRHEAETVFYRTLRRNTPASILRSCNFMVHLEIPSSLSEASAMPKRDKDLSPLVYGNGQMVRASISDALLRTRGESLDSIVLEYHKGSPYHLDVLNTLCEMRCEGLIRSISTKDFPSSLIQSAYECGFNIQSNDIVGCLLDTTSLERAGPDDDGGCLRLISSPLSGGILAQKYRNDPKKSQILDSSKIPTGATLDGCQRIMDTLEHLALKHQVSVASISLRWLLQLNKDNSISVGTLLGMDLVEEQGGPAFHRHRHLRQVFTFELAEEEMQLLAKVSGYAPEGQQVLGAEEHEIDFSNRALWI